MVAAIVTGLELLFRMRIKCVSFAVMLMRIEVIATWPNDRSS